MPEYVKLCRKVILFYFFSVLFVVCLLSAAVDTIADTQTQCSENSLGDILLSFFYYTFSLTFYGIFIQVSARMYYFIERLYASSCENCPPR